MPSLSRQSTDEVLLVSGYYACGQLDNPYLTHYAVVRDVWRNTPASVSMPLASAFVNAAARELCPHNYTKTVFGA